VIAAIAFKIIESRVRSKFSRGPFHSKNESADTKPPVAGPLEDAERRRKMDRLLTACGFPSLSELEPRFAKTPSLDDLM
jgi:hypothetical protein